jgi:hypothetical protein
MTGKAIHSFSGTKSAENRPTQYPGAGMDEKLTKPASQPSRAVHSVGQLDQSAVYLLWLDSKRKEFRAKMRRINHRIRRTLDKYGSGPAYQGRSR